MSILLLLIIIIILCATTYIGGVDEKVTRIVDLTALLNNPAQYDGWVIVKIMEGHVTLRPQRHHYESYPFLADQLNVADLIKLTHVVRDMEIPRIDHLMFMDAWISDVRYFPLKLIDYFQEQCRANCKRWRYKDNGHDHYQKNLPQYLANIKQKGLQPSYDTIMTEFLHSYTLCSEFPLHIVTTVITWLVNQCPLNHSCSRPRMLDMSAGRGSRMLGAMIMNVDYVGVDPDPCVHHHYDTMREFYSAVLGYKGQAIVHKDCFEKLPQSFLDEHAESFDFMFSSPPYFDQEIFSTNDTQSVHQYAQLDTWLEKFMLKPGGILAINIDNPRHSNVDFVNPIIALPMSRMRYMGALGIIRGPITFSIWCWRKI